MEKYICNKNVVSYLHYTIVFCPRYRRKIFDIDGLTCRFEDLVYDITKDKAFCVNDMKCLSDHVILSVVLHPDESVIHFVNTIKMATSSILRQEFKQLSAMSGLWTRCFFVSTDERVDDSIIENYVNRQKKRA